MGEKLFSDDINSSEGWYRTIRDDPRCANCKTYMEKLWDIYHPYADKDSPKKLVEDFHARFWEMYLTCTLIYNSFNVSQKRTGAKGPDILINDSSRRVFLEAVTSLQGADDNLDKVPSLKFNTPQNITDPDKPIILRYTNAIDVKYKKYNCYLKQGIVSPSDSYIIALNSSKIGIRAKLESDLPLIVKTVLPIGYATRTINEFPESTGRWHYQYRPNIPRSKSGSDVATDLFLRDEYAGISGVLFSYVDALNCPNQMGDDFIFIHNPKSTKNAVPDGYFKLGAEYFVNMEKDGFSISLKSWKD